MNLPTLSSSSTSRSFTDVFQGYVHKLKIEDGQFYDTTNLTTDYYPLLASRGKRGSFKTVRFSCTTSGATVTVNKDTFIAKVVTPDDYEFVYDTDHWELDEETVTLSNYGITFTGTAATDDTITVSYYAHTFKSYQGIAELNDKLIYADDGKIYYDDDVVISGLTSGQKTIVTTGAYIVVFPDKKYYNTTNATDSGNIEATLTLTNLSVDYKMCNIDGVEYGTATKSDTAPTSPSDGDLWIDTKYNILKQWTSSLSMWVDIVNVYTKICLPALPSGSRPTDFFSQYDGVTLSGLVASVAGLNGSSILYQVADNYIVAVGILDNLITQTGVNLTINRSCPDMDFVVECQNRLWGCKYGLTSTGTINEIYCCALGDFKNWNKFQGISTDSYVASVGTDGAWTGAINYLGYPTFFKENYIHRVSVSSEGAHQIVDTPCRGIQSGSSKSLVLINETLYYKSVDGICGYQGSFPTKVSDQLGDIKYYEACGGCFEDKYYVSMRTSSNEWCLFVADTEKGLWIKEDNLHAIGFARCGDELYAVSNVGELYALNGTKGNLETDIDWSAESGMLYYEYYTKKYVSRFNIRMFAEAGSFMKVFIEYDSDGGWIPCGNVFMFTGTGTVTIPIRPRRCDHMRIKITGHGSIKIYSIARILREGSDY